MRLSHLLLAATVLLGALQAPAQASAIVAPTPTISESVTKNSDGLYVYQFSIINSLGGLYNPNNLPLEAMPYMSLQSIEIPYFNDHGIQGEIMLADGWSQSIIATPPYTFASPNELVLTAPDGGLAVGQASGVFSYTSIYAPVKAPYSGTYAFGWKFYGDPLIPGSPDALAAGYPSAQLPAVPEPDSIAMLVLGLGLLAGVARRQRA
ncbi:MAG: PEP-CTERM sorting domain-containing protein [Sphingomonadaceae bacterium]